MKMDWFITIPGNLEEKNSAFVREGEQKGLGMPSAEIRKGLPLIGGKKGLGWAGESVGGGKSNKGTGLTLLLGGGTLA